MTSAEAELLVRDFLGAWEGRDIDYITSFFTEDAVYHNVPVAPIAGLANIRAIFQAFLGAFRSASLEIVEIAAAPGLVIAERMDRFVLNDGRKVDLPVTGVFILAGRKIVRFSDYFDLACFEKQSGMKL